MIPKIIHYVWLGHGEKSDLIKHCIESWKKYLPDYEIKEWNEDNFDIDYNKFTRQSYDARKFAFTSDVIRLYALYTEGGVYLDTDVEVFKPLDEFLEQPAFTGFEQPYYPVCATMGAEKGNPLIKELLDYYNDEEFEVKENWHDYTTNTVIISDILGEKGIDRSKNEIQKIENITIYPKEYFLDKNGYTVHWMNGSWGG
jgi:mannosyltransferase OCH1-like enzyme